MLSRFIPLIFGMFQTGYIFIDLPCTWKGPGGYGIAE